MLREYVDRALRTWASQDSRDPVVRTKWVHVFDAEYGNPECAVSEPDDGPIDHDDWGDD